MGEQKHTPGPWVADVYKNISEAIEDGFFQWAEEDYWRRHNLGKPACVFQLTPEGGHTGLPGCIEVEERNAYLIATAPDMYAALVRVWKEFGGDDLTEDDMDPDTWEMLQQVAEAIDKANGRLP